MTNYVSRSPLAVVPMAAIPSAALLLGGSVALALGCGARGDDADLAAGSPSTAEPPRAIAIAESVHDHLRDMESWRTPQRAVELAQARAQVMELERTERVWITEAGRRSTFDSLDAPGSGALRLGVRWLGPQPASAPLRAIVQLWPLGAPPQRREVPLGPFDADGVAPFELHWSELQGVQHIALALEGAAPGTLLALVRPNLERDYSPEALAEDPQQVIVITLDTVRRDFLGAYGHPRARTPHLDALAADGVLFEEAFSVTNVTNPAHTSLFTSLHLKEHQVRDNFTRLAPECPTLMEVLGSAGFRTGAFAASFNFQAERSDLGGRFDDFFPCREFHERRAEDVNADALPWFADQRSRDFFAWVHYFDAHLPYVPPAPFREMFEVRGEAPMELPLRASEEDLTSLYGDSRNLNDFVARYLGELAYLDAEVGRLIETLKALGIYQRALIVVTADHGEAFGEQGVFCEHRGLHDAVTAVPLLVKLPAMARQSGRIEGLTTLLDIAPTIFDYVGVTPPPSWRGTGSSLRARIESGAPGAQQVFAEHVEGLSASLRTPEDMAILGLGDRQFFPRFATRAGQVQLYTSGATDAAQNDLAEMAPQRAEQLRKRLDAFLQQARPYASESVDDKAYRERLEQLGYVDPQRDD